ncbi:unnamed protein product [Lactuca virosa]|uniref:Ribosomal protein 50S-L18Ae/60S-L20/60S-L18A domain-containing protein n=1 Tax=Lactuca virosa TaxID=75947 RepID=A0AAU9NN48_9ASTR|nr:unnamed protein product [Lactuca virosa]
MYVIIKKYLKLLVNLFRTIGVFICPPERTVPSVSGCKQCMKLSATNEVRAKSNFWYFLRKLKKVKKINGQMLALNEHSGMFQGIMNLS